MIANLRLRKIVEKNMYYVLHSIENYLYICIVK